MKKAQVKQIAEILDRIDECNEKDSLQAPTTEIRTLTARIRGILLRG